MEYILFPVGILLLVKGADWLVEGASALAGRIGVSRLMIGLTIVAVGTTLPEFMVSVVAVTRSSEKIVLGNIIGSCIANILLILGIIAFLTRLRVRNSTTWKEIPFAFLAALLLFVLAMRPLLNDGGENYLTRVDGIIMLLFFAIFLYYVFELAIKSRRPPAEKEIKARSGTSVLLLIPGGVLALYLGGAWTVKGAATAAEALGLSEFLISATVVAIGTSLPELTTAVTAAAKNQVDLAVGNVIGANILNIFWVLGATSLIAPIRLPTFIKFDATILLIATFALFLFMFTSRKHELDRWEGGFFLLGYVAYITFLILRG